MVHTFEPTLGESDWRPNEESETVKQTPSNKADTFPQPRDDELRSALTIAKVEVRKPDYVWNGKTPLEVVSTYQEALKSVGIEDVQALEERTKRYLIGFWGERALAEVPIAKAKTIYAGEDAEPQKYLESQHVDVETYTGINRKDLMIRRYYLAQLESDKRIIKNTAEEFNEVSGREIFPDDAYEVIGLQLDVLQNYDKAVAAWKRENPKNGYPQIGQLLRWAITDEIKRQKQEKKGTWSNLYKEEDVKTVQAWSDFILEQQNTLIFHENDPLLVIKNAAQLQKAEVELAEQLTSLAGLNETEGPTMDKANRRVAHFQNIWEAKREKARKYADSYYFDIAVPDAILTTEDNQLSGVMEVKCYTQDEVERWVELLQYGLENEPNAAVRFGQEGLQVIAHLDPRNLDSPVMQFGFNPDAYSRFLNMVEGTPPNKLAKVPNKGDRMVLRFTDDVSDDVLVALGDAIQKYGYTDFVIQKVGLTEQDIAQIAQKMLKRDLQTIQAATTDQGREIFQKLAQPESWN